LKIIRSIFLLLLINIIFCGSALSQFGTVYFVPDTTVVGVNDSCLIDIRVDPNLDGIHCYILSVGFDTSLVELSEVSEGPLLPNAGQTFFFWNENDGGYDIGSCLLGYGLFANGPGILATMKFVSQADTGISSLHFTSQEFTDTSSNPIYVLPLFGAIVVTDTLVPVYDDGADAAIPHRFMISRIFPNPFNSRTSIEYHLGKPGFAEIRIYDMLGRLRDVLVSAYRPAGKHQIFWDAENMESGVYFARLNISGCSDTRKMILLK
jgi:hypothetical protein